MTDGATAVRNDPQLDSRIEIRDAAVSYATRNWQIVVVHHPVGDGCSCGNAECVKGGKKEKSRGKHPRGGEWGKLATANTQLILARYHKYPISNVGIKLGPESGIIDLEIDDVEIGEAKLREIFGGDIPRTPTFKGRQGPHRLFQWRDGLPQKAHIPLGWGDLKLGAGTKTNDAGELINLATQSVFPPSMHYSGVRYEWLVRPEDCNVAALPDRVVAWMIANEVKAPTNGQRITFNDKVLDTSPDVDTVLRKLRRGAKAAKFSSLFDSGETGNDASRADMALCARIAFYSGPDCALIDQIFRQSKLMRDKWDERRGDSTYGRKTIEKILSGRTEYYDWDQVRRRAEERKQQQDRPVELAGLLRKYDPPGGESEEPAGEVELNDEMPPEDPPEDDKPKWKSNLPEVWLPDGNVTYRQCSGILGGLMGHTNRFYLRGRVTMRAIHASDGGLELEPIRPAAAVSDFEGVARLMRTKVKPNGDIVDVPAVCNESVAKALIAAETFAEKIPPIEVLSRCPLLVDKGGELRMVSGYDRESAIYAMGREPLKVSLCEAIACIDTLLHDFDFNEPGDKSRAAASLITPALVLGGLLGAGTRVPIDFGEANDSQSGKGYRMKLISAIYSQKVGTVTQQGDRGVGSTKESFDGYLIAGHSFIALDNLRGGLNFPWLESFLTEPSYNARIPYSPQVQIDPTRVVLMATSNKVEMTVDLANRSSIVRILKHPDGYDYKTFTEGDLLAHVRVNQPRYLGAIFAIISEWHRLRRPSLPTPQHDFRIWAGTLGFITEKILGLAPMLEGHREVQKRTTNSNASWLRSVALAVLDAGMGDRWLRPHNLLQLVLNRNIETKGLSPDLDTDNSEDFQKGTRAIGKLLGGAFAETNEIEIDGMLITRQIGRDSNSREMKEFSFSPYSRNAPNDPAMTPAMKTPIPAMPAMGHHLVAYAHARTPAHGQISGPIAEIAGDSGKTSPRTCNHLDPATWENRGGMLYCPGCGAFKGHAPEPELGF